MSDRQRWQGARWMGRCVLLGLLLTASATAYELDQHLWTHRLLFLVAPSPADPTAQARLRDAASRRDALADRDLRVFELYRDEGRRDGETLSRAEVHALRRHFRLSDDDQTLILVGLDGGIKRRAPLETELRELYLQIDAMPMRRADIEAKEAAGIPVTEP